ncbi:MAG TPA: amidohydrolase family protein [Syntrophorhabdaceae bacterium]|nr:amidohydrolase family protein [Syntrophorhabdaceae bacterium]HQM80121.1 amidohydrolase family protein [Syntrophorhabdaceae bacterium]
MKEKLRKGVSRRDFIKIGAVATAGVLMGVARIESSVPTADTVFVNGAVITVDRSDAIVQAVAVRNGTILDAGTREAVSHYIGNTTKVIDLAGRTMTPGLIDSHAHLPHFGARERNMVKLQGLETKEEVLERLAERAKKTPPGRFISGWGIESNDLAFLNRRDLDRITTEHPVLAVHTGGQWGFANSYALKAAGIDRSTPNPPGGLVRKAPNGEPTGLLIHYPALYLVRRIAPPLSDEEIDKNIRHSAMLYAGDGVTTVQDNFFDMSEVSANRHAGVYLGQALSGSLPVRVKIWPYIPSIREASFAVRELLQSQTPRPDSPFADVIRYKNDNPEGFARVWGGMKFAIDGGGPTSLWYRGERGITLHSTEDLHSMVKLFHQAGQQISVHAVGDKAVDIMLDAFEEVLKAPPRGDCRHRIEHAICPQTTALDRIRRLGIIICTHPQWMYLWGEKMGGLKGQRVFPLRSYMGQGIPVAIGADPPAFSLWQPQYALWNAVARTTKGGYHFTPEESISIKDALWMQTMGSAYAAFQEKEIGSIEKGKKADLVVWDRNFYTIPINEIKDAKALLTMVGGKVVYERDPAKQ